MKQIKQTCQIKKKFRLYEIKKKENYFINEFNERKSYSKKYEKDKYEKMKHNLISENGDEKQETIKLSSI